MCPNALLQPQLPPYYFISRQKSFDHAVLEVIRTSRLGVRYARLRLGASRVPGLYSIWRALHQHRGHNWPMLLRRGLYCRPACHWYRICEYISTIFEQWHLIPMATSAMSCPQSESWELKRVCALFVSCTLVDSVVSSNESLFCRFPSR